MFVRIKLVIACMSVAAIAMLPAGCDKNAGPAAGAGLSGKVSLGGQPVSGTVVFVGADKKEYSALIMPSGMYSIPELPAGEYKIAVRGAGGTMMKGPKGANNMPDMAGSAGGGAPPAKYASPDNGLTYKYAGGKQTHDIELNS